MTIDEIDRAIPETFEILDFYEIDNLSWKKLVAVIIEVCREALTEGWYRKDAPLPMREIRHRVAEIVHTPPET